MNPDDLNKICANTRDKVRGENHEHAKSNKIRGRDEFWGSCSTCANTLTRFLEKKRVRFAKYGVYLTPPNSRIGYPHNFVIVKLDDYYLVDPSYTQFEGIVKSCVCKLSEWPLIKYVNKTFLLKPNKLTRKEIDFVEKIFNQKQS